MVDYGLVRLRSAAGSTIKYRIATSLASLVLGGALLTQVYFTTTLFSLLKSSGGASGEYAVAYRHKVSLADHLAKTYGSGCFSLNHEWRPLYKMRMGREIESLVRRQEPEGLCRTPEPVKLYLLETIDRPLSPEAEAGLRPYERFGPVVVYKRAVSNEH